MDDQCRLDFDDSRKLFSYNPMLSEQRKLFSGYGACVTAVADLWNPTQAHMERFIVLIGKDR
jgi:hypothetical protein